MQTKVTTPQEFVASSAFDGPLAPYDIRASIAHARMLGRQGIIAKKDAARIALGLAKIGARLARGGKLLKAEDVHYALEKTLFAEIGRTAGRLHTARSRNDQTVTALRLYVRDQIDQTDARLQGLIGAILKQAEKHFHDILPGMTHLQPAQPVVLAHYLLAYGWMFQRDRERLADARKRANVLPLGAAALAGTSFPIDRKWVAKELGFAGIVENSMDAVSDRDFLVEFVSALALVATHLSRLCEDLIIWASPAFGFVTVADPFVTGSSIMPQKRNPDVAELIRGKCARVTGELMSLLGLLKAQPLTYNRDLQEDKPPVFEAVALVESSLDMAEPMAATLEFHPKKMREACKLGYLLATDLADALVRKGLPFRQAHGIVAAAVTEARRRGIGLEDVPLSLWRRHSDLIGPWIKEILSFDRAVAARKSPGGTAPEEVKKQAALLRRKAGVR